MSKVPISVCMIAKNEERYIEECLKRLQPYGFEIVVADTGSTDRTKEIAEQYADKVVDFEWINDFSAARNYCASCASNSWILALDCDEYVNNADVPWIKSLMKNFSKGIGVIRMNNLVYNAAGEKEYGSENVLRFYHRSFYRFESPIHEQLVAKDKNIERQSTKFMLPMEVVHHGYALTPEEMQKKQERNIALIKSNVGKGGDDPYLYFQMGQSLYIMNRIDEAVEAYETVLRLNPPMDRAYVEMMIVSLSMAYVRQNRLADAMELLEKYEGQYKSARYVYTHAGILYAGGQKMKALLKYVTTTTLPDFDGLGESKLHCYENIIDMYREYGEEDMATGFKEKYEHCLAERNRIVNS
ncbi:MAG: glycosyltransferase [Lachnospiraceae bacterium]|nr:glycosyltransferase [Lachnospiraceae bacterium]